MKFCNGDDGVCKYFLTYNGRKCCMNETVRSQWSKHVCGIRVGNILKCYMKQFGVCGYYEGRFKKNESI